ncbi:MAG: ester cyclase [Candidatus Krumholzibacteria bacterium]|nr:ester cyclase [Candidatus Krumholzibacteria bacterium]
MNSRIFFTVLLAIALVASVAGAGTIDENKALVANFIEANNAKDFDNLPTYVTDNFRRHSQASPGVVVANKEQFIKHMGDDLNTFPDAKIDVQQVVAEGDRVAVWGSYLGTYNGEVPGSGSAGRKVNVDFSAIYRIEGDKIAELWITWDNLAVRTQLGEKTVPGGIAE